MGEDKAEAGNSLNPIEEVAEVIKGRGITFIVDAMSSFGGVPIDVKGLGIDFLVSSANKCIQGVPGFGFILNRIQQTGRGLAMYH